LISYDDEESITAKLDYILDNDLGGMMFWELSADTASNEITALMANSLRP
jgi:chitinase